MKGTLSKKVLVGLVILISVVVSCFILFTNHIIWLDGSETWVLGFGVDDNRIYDMIENQKFIEFSEFGNTTKMSFKDLGLVINSNDSKLHKGIITVDCTKSKFDYDFTSLKDNLGYLNRGRNSGKDAEIVKGETGFVLNDAIKGDYVDLDKIVSCISNNPDIGVIDVTQFYTASQDVLKGQEDCKSEINRVKGTYIEYTNNYKINLMDLYDFLVVIDNKVVFDNTRSDELFNFVDKLIEKELISYDTYGQKRNFSTTNSGVVTISGGTYGDVFDSDKEAEYVIEKFKKFESESDRVPIYKRDLPDELGNTYIEVSIDEQHLWYYKNGELVMESDVVTGTKGRHDTPTGVYYISECINGKYLKGDGYRTWVNKWMRLTNTGIGLHDATWRSSFGGQIYKSGGSHGCINLPKKFAYDLFEEAYVNMPVVVY